MFPLSNLKVQFEGLVRAVVFCNIPEQFKSVVHAFYSRAFQAYQSSKKNERGQMDISGMTVIYKVKCIKCSVGCEQDVFSM